MLKFVGLLAIMFYVIIGVFKRQDFDRKNHNYDLWDLVLKPQNPGNNGFPHITKSAGNTCNKL